MGRDVRCGKTRAFGGEKSEAMRDVMHGEENVRDTNTEVHEGRERSARLEKTGG